MLSDRIEDFLDAAEAEEASGALPGMKGTSSRMERVGQAVCARAEGAANSPAPIAMTSRRRMIVPPMVLLRKG